GKELVARAIHERSHRSDGPFVVANCSAYSSNLLESELFGHEKGSFTGALRRREGQFRQAHLGSLFLDEVSEMSLAMQAKLLRVLQEKEFTRVGGEDLIKVDVRIIAATNKMLSNLVRDGAFREDLYYRLNVITLAVPPVRDRREDIPLLADFFLSSFAARNNKPVKGFTPQAMDKLIRHHWPGNVRELMNVVESAVVLTGSQYLTEHDLTIIDNDMNIQKSRQDFPLDLPLDEMEKTTILKTLESVGGNKSEAARRLGITRVTLHKKLKRYEIDES
ncbi:MAG: sigma-54 dependent transcriptional regulator, partial [Desulfomonilia bacterium]|nr:sigma-54 dependent transcriptional regulator [Desulfomonilia bacterium]